MVLTLFVFSAGILFLGIHSIILSFQIHKLRQLNKNLGISNEELNVKTLEQTRPDILAEEAAVLQLSEKGNVRYLILEPPTLAGRAGSFGENLAQ
jgi:hypothetical protein